MPDHGKESGRRSIRLRGYDYTRPGAYFITICTFNHQCILGQIPVGATGGRPNTGGRPDTGDCPDGNGIRPEIQLTEAGRIVADEWVKTAVIRDEIELDEWVVMPNHIHGIVWIRNSGKMHRPPRRMGDRQVAPTGPEPESIGAVVAGFKSSATRRINALRCTPGVRVWQRNYWEHVVRNESELNKFREYICDNPLRWELDRFFIP